MNLTEFKWNFFSLLFRKIALTMGLTFLLCAAIIRDIWHSFNVNRAFLVIISKGIYWPIVIQYWYNVVFILWRRKKRLWIPEPKTEIYWAKSGWGLCSVKSMPHFVWFCRFPHMQSDLNFTAFYFSSFSFVSFPVKLPPRDWITSFELQATSFIARNRGEKAKLSAYWPIVQHKATLTAALFKLIKLFIYTWHASLCQVRFSLFALSLPFQAAIRFEENKKRSSSRKYRLSLFCVARKNWLRNGN